MAAKKSPTKAKKKLYYIVYEEIKHDYIITVQVKISRSLGEVEEFVKNKKFNHPSEDFITEIREEIFE